MPNTNQNTRQATQNEAESVRGLARHNQDYHRLPDLLRAIVDAYAMLDDANDYMAEARFEHGVRPEDAPSTAMVVELSGLVEHTRAELRRHGVIEGALAWLASHPEGWDEEPEDTALYESSTQVPERYLVFPGMPSYCRHGVDLADECAACQADAEAFAERADLASAGLDRMHAAVTEALGLPPTTLPRLPLGADSCPSCGGALATAAPHVSKCLACGAEWS